MESENRQSPEDSPQDAHAIKEVISKVKSQGLFDQFRKECLADVDTKPAYNNLIQRVEKFVERFLNGQKWNTNVNKNQLRDALRRQLNNSGVMNIGVDRIIEQVVNPKILLGIKPKIDEAVCSYLGVDLKTRQEEQQKRKQEQQRLMLQQQQLQQQHLQNLMNQNVKPDENFARIHANPWSHTANGANFPGSPMAGGINSAGGSFNQQGFGGIIQPFYTGGWAPGLQGMEGFNQTMQPVIPGQPMIPGQQMGSPFGNCGITSTVNNVSAFSSSASPSVSNVNTSFSTPLPAQSTAVQNIPDFSKPPPGLPGAPLLNSASSLGSSPVPGMPLQSNTVAPPGILPGSVSSIIRPPPPGSVPPPPGTVPVIAPSTPLRSIPTTPTIPALISHTLSKVSKEELTPEKIAVFKTAAAFITKTVNNAQGTPGADLATMFSPRVLAEAMMAESGKPLTKHEIRAARRKERMKEFERLKAEREREEEEEKRRIMAFNSECRHNLMDVFKAAEDVSEDEEAFDMLIDAEELGNKHKQGVILSDDSKDEEEKEKPPTSQPGKKYNFAWDVDRDVGGLSDVTVSSIHTSDISSFEELSSDSEDPVEPNADDEQEKDESDLNTGEQSASSETIAEETTLISEERQLSELANFSEKPNASESSPVHEMEVVKTVDTPEHQFAEVVPSVSAAVSGRQKTPKSVPNKPRKLVALSYKYSDSDDDETREERKARIAKEKEERYMKRQQRRTEMEAKRKERDEERARLREEKKKQKAQQEEIGAEEKVALESAAEYSTSEDHNASVNSTEPETSSRSTPRKRKNKAEMKEQLLQQKVFEKKAALQRQRTRNNRYVPDAFNSIFSEKKSSNQSYTDAAVDPEEVVTFDGNLEIVEVTVDQECVVETIGEDMDTVKDDLILQCRSPYSDISDRSMSDKSEDEQKVTVEMEEVSSDEDIEAEPAEKEIEDEAGKTFPPSVHESDSNDSRIQNVVSLSESVNLVTTQFSSVMIPSDENSLIEEDFKRKSLLTDGNDQPQPGETDDVCSSHIRTSTPPLSFSDEKSSRAAPSSISDNEDRTSQRSNGAVSSHSSLPQEGEKIIEDNVKDSTAEDGEMASPKEPVDIMKEMELEPVSDEDSPLDNLSVNGSSDGEKEEGEEKDSDKEDDRSSHKSSHKSSQAITVETPSKTSDVASKDDEASDEGEIKSDSEDSAKAVVEEKERTANRKPIELVDFGEAEKRARGSRSFYPEAQPDRARTSRVMPVSSLPPAASYRGGYTPWSQPDTTIHSQYPPVVRYSLSHEAITASRMRSPMASVYDGGESETSSHSRSSVRLRDDVPPPYPIDGVKRKHRSPASDQGSSSLYKTLSPPSPVSSVASSRSRSSSARSRSQSGSESSSSSSFSSSRSSQKKKHLKKKRSSKRRSTDTEKAASLKSQTSTSKLPTSERIVSPVKFSEIPPIPVRSQSRERLLSSGHESISSDELPYFPDEEPPKSSPKATISKSPGKNSPSSSSISSKSAQSNRKKKRESISSSELIYSPSRLKSPPHSSAASKEDDDDDNISIERPPLSPGRSSISSDELPDYPVEDPDPTFMQQFSPHQPPLPSDLPPLPEDTDGFQPPLPQDSPPMLLDIQPPPPPVDEEDSKMQPFDSQEVEEGEISDSEKSLLVPPEFEEGEIEDTVESYQAHFAQRAFANPRANFLPPLKQQILLQNSVALSPFSSHVFFQCNLKPPLPSCTVAALHTPDTHSQTLSQSDRISPASHPSSQHDPTVQAFSRVADQEQNPNGSKDAHHTTVLDCPKVQIREKTTAVITTNQFGTTVSSAQDLCGNTLGIYSTTCAEELGTTDFHSRAGRSKTVETTISKSEVSLTDLHHKVEGNKQLKRIVSENVFVPAADLHHKVEGNKNVERIVSEDVFYPAADLHHKVEGNKQLKRIVSENVFDPAADLRHKVEGNKEVERIVSEDMFDPAADLHHKVEGNKDVERIVSENVFDPAADLHHKVEGNKEVEGSVSEDVFDPAVHLRHKVEGSKDVERIVSEDVSVPVIELHLSKSVETNISDSVNIPMTDLHLKVEESKHKENIDIIVTDTDSTHEKVIITATTLPLSDLEKKIENNKNALHSDSVVSNNATEYSGLQTSEDSTNNMSEPLSLKIIREIENGKSLAGPGLQCEDRNVLQLISDRSIPSSEVTLVSSNLAINMKDFEKDVSKLCSESKLEGTTNTVFSDQTLENIDAKTCEVEAVHITCDAIQEKNSSAKNSDTTNIKDITDAVLQSCSDTTNIDDIKNSVLPSNSDLIIEDRNVTVLQPTSYRKIEDMKDEISQSWPEVANRDNKSYSPQETLEINMKNEAIVPPSSSEVSMEDLHVLPKAEVKYKDIENKVSQSEFRNEDFNKSVSQCVSGIESDRSVLALSSLCLVIENTKSAIILQPDSSITLVKNERVSDSACVSDSAKTVDNAEVESTEEVDMSKQSSLITTGESAHDPKDKSHAINKGKTEIPSVPLLLCEEVVSRPEDHKEGNVPVSSELSLLHEEVASTPQLQEDLASSCSLESTIVPEKSIPSQTASSLQRELSEECSLESSTLVRPGESPLLAQPLTINTEAESLHLNTQQSVQSHTVEFTASEIRECSKMCSSKETSAISDTSNSVLASEFSVLSNTVDSHKVIDSSLSSENTAQSTSSELVLDEILTNTEIKTVHITCEVMQENIPARTSLLPEKDIVKETEQQSNSLSTAQSLSSELISDQTLKNTEAKPVHITCDAIQEDKSSLTLSVKNAVEQTGVDTESSQALVLSEEPISLSEISQENKIAPTDQDNSTAASTPLKTDMLGSSSQSEQATVTSLEPKLEHSKEPNYSLSEISLANNIAPTDEDNCTASSTPEVAMSLKTDMLGSSSQSEQATVTSVEPKLEYSKEAIYSLSETSLANNIVPTDQDNSTAASTPLKTDMLGSSSQSEQATVTSLEPKLEHSKEAIYSPQAAALPSPGQRSVSSEETYETSAAASIIRNKRRMPEDSGNSSDTSAASNDSLPKRRRRGGAAENDKLILTPASAPTSRPGTRLQHQQQQELAKPQTRGRSNSLPSNRAAKRKKDNDESPPTRKHKR